MTEYQDYKIWVDLAKEMILLGKLETTKRLLTEAQRYAKIYKDFCRLGEIELIHSEILFLEVKIVKSVQI